MPSFDSQRRDNNPEQTAEVRDLLACRVELARLGVGDEDPALDEWNRRVESQGFAVKARVEKLWSLIKLVHSARAQVHREMDYCDDPKAAIARVVEVVRRFGVLPG